jgi:hypothetical protein
MISSAYSTDSSAAATQPAATSKVLDSAKLQALAALTPSAVSDVVAGLLQPPGAGDLASREALFRAVQLSTSPPMLPPDPLLEARGADSSSAAPLDRAEFDAEQARLAAWQKLIAKMSDLYPKAKPQSDLVKLQFTPADSKGKPSSFFATHASPEPLTNVTLAVESVRPLTSPSPTAVHYYFIPRWSPGQKIFLPTGPRPNVASPQLLDSPGPSPMGVRGGVIAAKTQLWSDKITQPSQDTSFDAKLEWLGRAQLDEAYRLADEVLRRPAATSRPAGAAPLPPPTTRPTIALIPGPVVPPRPDLDDNAPDLARARAVAGRASALLAQSPQAEEAKTVADKPLTALRDLRKRQIDAFINALALRTMRSGIWVIQQPGMLAKLAKQSDREAALSAAGGAGGRLTLTIDSRTPDGTSVAITLSSPDQPEQKKKFTGRLQADASNAGRLLLNLRATQPPPTKAPNEGDLKRVIYWSSLLLELRGNSLIGVATAGPPEAVTTLNVAFGPASAAPAPAAAPGQRQPPQKPAK